MIYSHKTDGSASNLTPAEREKMQRLRYTESTAWMIDKSAEALRPTALFPLWAAGSRTLRPHSCFPPKSAL